LHVLRQLADVQYGARYVRLYHTAVSRMVSTVFPVPKLGPHVYGGWSRAQLQCIAHPVPCPNYVPNQTELCSSVLPIKHACVLTWNKPTSKPTTVQLHH